MERNIEYIQLFMEYESDDMPMGPNAIIYRKKRPCRNWKRKFSNYGMAFWNTYNYNFGENI